MFWFPLTLWLMATGRATVLYRHSAILQALDDDDDPLKVSEQRELRRNRLCPFSMQDRMTFFTDVAFFVCRAVFFYRQLGPAGSYCLGP